MTTPKFEDDTRRRFGDDTRRRSVAVVVFFAVGLGVAQASAQTATTLAPTTETSSAPATTSTTRAPVAGRSAGEADGEADPATGPVNPTDPQTVTLAPLEGYTGGGTVTGDNPVVSASAGTTPKRLAPVVLEPRAALETAREAALTAGRVGAQRQAEADASEHRQAQAQSELARVDAALARSIIEEANAQQAVAEAKTELTGTAVALFTQGRPVPDLLSELVDNAAVSRRATRAVATDSALEQQLAHLAECNTALAAARQLHRDLAKYQPEAAAHYVSAQAATAAASTAAQQAALAQNAAEAAAANVAARSQPLLAVVKGFAALADQAATFPIAGRWDFEDTWGFPRSGGRRHKGNDLFCDAGAPLVAIEDGIARPDGDTLGGTVVYLEGTSGALYYYAHLATVDRTVARTGGLRVKAGDVIGYCGNSGNAFDTPAHLHLQIAPPGGEWVNPYPLLRTLADGVMNARAVEATRPPAG